MFFAREGINDMNLGSFIVRMMVLGATMDKTSREYGITLD